MSLAQLEAVLTSLQSPDNNVRAEAERAYASGKEDPLSFFTAMVKVRVAAGLGPMHGV